MTGLKLLPCLWPELEHCHFWYNVLAKAIFSLERLQTSLLRAVYKGVREIAVTIFAIRFK